jgi:hypothetical protein
MFIGEGGSSPACSREEDGDGEGRRGSRTRRRGAEKVPAALLLHFPASVRPTEAERGGATRVQELAGVDGYCERERTGGREDVWELAGDGVGSTACSEGAFIGQEGAGRGVQKVAGAGGSGDVHGQSRARRPWGRAGGVWSRRRGTVGRRWRAHAGRHRAESRGQGEGGPGGFFPLLPCLTAWVGAGEAGLDRGMSTSMATGLGRM